MLLDDSGISSKERFLKTGDATEDCTGTVDQLSIIDLEQKVQWGSCASLAEAQNGRPLPV